MDENTCIQCGTASSEMNYFFTVDDDGRGLCFCANCTDYLFVHNYVELGRLSNAIVSEALRLTAGDIAAVQGFNSFLTNELRRSILEDRQIVVEAVSHFNEEVWHTALDGKPMRDWIHQTFFEMDPINGLTIIDAKGALYVRVHKGIGHMMIVISDGKTDTNVTLTTSEYWHSNGTDRDLTLHLVSGTVVEMIALLNTFAISYLRNELTVVEPETSNTWLWGLVNKVKRALSQIFKK